MEISEYIGEKRRNHSNSAETKEQNSFCKALDIPHILDKILLCCEKTQLLQCRFVSCLWREVSTLHLQKIVYFVFVDNALQNRKKTLEELMTIFYNLQRLDPPRKAFICTHFVFMCCTRKCCYTNNAQDNNKVNSNPVLQNFLSLYGAHVQKLELYFHNFCEAHIPTEKMIMHEIEKLLTVDLPNLRNFTFDIGSQQQGTDMNELIPLPLTRTQLNEIHSQYSIFNSGRNINLKFIHFTNSASAAVIEMAQLLAPNLNEIRLQRNKIIYLLEPQNRINVLKMLEFYPFTLATYSIFDKLAKQCLKQILKLRILSFCLEQKFSHDSYEFTPQMRSRIIDILSTILKCSWESLEIICWCGAVTTTGLKWPLLMPRVKKFWFNKHFKTIEKNIFPPKFPWCKTFPRLRNISINNCVKDGSPQDLFKALNLEPIKSVIYASTCWNLNQVSETELKDIFEIHFPNAKIDVEDKTTFLPD